MAPKSKHPHLLWLKKSANTLTTADGKSVDVWELTPDNTDQDVLKAWARHFREHYCLDSQIDELRAGTPFSRSEYLIESVFPAATSKLGPAVRSGDFAEILIADLLEDQLGFWVPRLRYAGKAVRDESVKGTDVLGFRFEKDDGTFSPNDVLLVAESKAQMSGNKAKPRLQDAVNDSAKDALRKSESLNFAKQRLLAEQRRPEALLVQRFQDPNDRPYVMQSGAAAVFCSSVFDPGSVASTDCSKHGNAQNLFLIVIHSQAFMKLVHALYERAAHDA